MTAEAMEDGHANVDSHHRHASLLSDEALRGRLFAPARLDLRGKGDVRRIGGYIHAGLHALGSLPAFFIAGLEPLAIVSFALAEFVVHYTIDHTKAGISRRSPAAPSSSAYWALHGADQLLHQLTYVGLVIGAVAMVVGSH